MKLLRPRSLVVGFAAGLVVFGLSACTRSAPLSLARLTPSCSMGRAAEASRYGPDARGRLRVERERMDSIPVQVTGSDYVSPGQIYHLPPSSYPTLYGTTTPYKILVYTPPPTLTAGYTSNATYTPADFDPSFDANDELSFLANDTGEQAGSSAANPTPGST